MNHIKVLEQKINQLPPVLINDLELFIDFLLNRNKETKHKKLKQDWAGSLKKYRSEFSSVELQKKALDWRIK